MASFADAFEADDIDGIIALLTENAGLTMPPSPLEYQGSLAIPRSSARSPRGGAADATGWCPLDPTRHRVAELRSNRLPGGATPWQKTFRPPVKAGVVFLVEARRWIDHDRHRRWV